MRSKGQARSYKRRARWKNPLPEFIIDVDNYKKVTPPSLSPDVVPLIEVVTEQLTEPSDEPEYEVKQLLEQALADNKIVAPLAACSLHSMAIQCIKALDILAETKPELLRPIASKRTNWPALYSRSPLNPPRIEKRLEAIDFATKSEAIWIKSDDVTKNFSEVSFESAKGWAFLLINSIHTFRIASVSTTDSTERFKEYSDGSVEMVEAIAEYYQYHLQYAIGMIAESHVDIVQKYTFALVEECVHLPDFSPDKTATEAWWDVGYRLLMLNTDGHPEKVTSLYEIGRCREKHYSGLKFTMKGDVYKPESVKSNVRSKILTDLKEEFARLANQHAKTDRSKEKSKKF